MVNSVFKGLKRQLEYIFPLEAVSRCRDRQQLQVGEIIQMCPIGGRLFLNCTVLRHISLELDAFLGDTIIVVLRVKNAHIPNPIMINYNMDYICEWWARWHLAEAMLDTCGTQVVCLLHTS